MMNFRITSDRNEHDIHEIYEMLKEYNLNHRETSQNVPVGVFLEDASGGKLAGLTGESFGNWLCIQFLFVSESLSGQGIGSRLLDSVESEARQRGCKYAFVDFFSFQAPAFYKKTWIPRGFHPRRISIHRKKALLHERITLIQICGGNNEIHRSVDRNKGYREKQRVLSRCIGAVCGAGTISRANSDPDEHFA